LKNGCLISISILALVFILFFLGLRKLFYIERVSKKEMIENYEEHKREIDDVISYYKSILPENTNCSIEFNNKKVEIFHLYENEQNSHNWSSSKNKIPIDSLLNEIGWTQSEFRTLRTKLKSANAISIGGSTKIHLGLFRTGMAMYGIDIHPDSLDENGIKMNNDSCNSLFYKENISFTFGGGAFGSNCFLRID